MRCSSCWRSISSLWIRPFGRSFCLPRAGAPKKRAASVKSRLKIFRSRPVPPHRSIRLPRKTRSRRPIRAIRRLTPRRSMRSRRPTCRSVLRRHRPIPPEVRRAAALMPRSAPRPKYSRRSRRRTPMSAAATSCSAAIPQATTAAISSSTAIRGSIPIRAVRAWDLRVRPRTRTRLPRPPAMPRLRATRRPLPGT